MSSNAKDNSAFKNKIDPSKVTLLTHPLVTLKVTAILLGRLLKGTMSFIHKNLAMIISILGIVGAFLYAPGPHE